MIPKDMIVILGECFENRCKALAVRNGNIVDLGSVSCEEHEEADTRIMTHHISSIYSKYTREQLVQTRI